MKNPINSWFGKNLKNFQPGEHFSVLLKHRKIKNLALEIRISIFPRVTWLRIVWSFRGGWLPIASEHWTFNYAEKKINIQGTGLRSWSLSVSLLCAKHPWNFNSQSMKGHKIFLELLTHILLLWKNNYNCSIHRSENHQAQ